MATGPPNVLFLVWDACRHDYAAEYAETLTTLGESNCWFERAVTPAPWSLPAHASLFTGQSPREHGRTRLGDDLDGLPLARRLSERGYTCYGVSANGFACQRTGFHDGFDEFYYTRGRERFAGGLDVSGTALAHLRETGSKTRTAMRTARSILAHERPLRSLANAGAVGLGALAVRWGPLQRVPHPLFAADSGYVYSPAANTDRLVDVIRREAHTEAPFFAFANYMDTHRPYVPDAAKQRRHLGRELPRSELERLNDEVAAPWSFAAASAVDVVDEDDVEAVRGLYAGEVETVDEHLARLLEVLEATGQREDTLVVVTSDHGENLGDIDERGQRRMGHEASVSDPLVRVPLVVAHPDLNAASIERPVSLSALFDLVTDPEPFLAAGGDADALATEDGDVVTCQYPAAGGEHLYEKHPDVPDAVLDYRISDHAVVAYGQDWRVGVDTTGDRWAVSGGQRRPVADAPDRLVTACETQLAALDQRSEDPAELDDEEIAQLEALGYL